MGNWTERQLRANERNVSFGGRGGDATDWQRGLNEWNRQTDQRAHLMKFMGSRPTNVLSRKSRKLTPTSGADRLMNHDGRKGVTRMKMR
jgi:hypothetical protein